MPATAEQKQSVLAYGLATQGFVVVENPLQRSAYEEYASLFGALIDDPKVGPERLTRVTQGSVTPRLGGTLGYFESRASERGGGKKSFMHRMLTPKFLPKVRPRPDGMEEGAYQRVLDFIDQGDAIMFQLALAMQSHVAALDLEYPGLYDAHYGTLRSGRVVQDFDMRIVQYDPAADPTELVSRFHPDTSSFTLHAFESEPGSFCVATKSKIRPNLIIHFPTTNLQGEGVLFTGSRLRRDDRYPNRPQSHENPVVVFPDFPGAPLQHGAVAAGGFEEVRRTVIVAQLQPNPKIRLSVDDETYGQPNASERVIIDLGDSLAKRQQKPARQTALLETVGPVEQFKANTDHLISEVHHYPFPEVLALIDSLHLDTGFYRYGNTVEDARSMLDSYHFDPKLDLPAIVDINDLHEIGVQRIHDMIKDSFPGLERFRYRYPLAGSYPAIVLLLADLKAKGKFERLAVLDGEYGGYKLTAKSLGIPVKEYKDLEDAIPNKDELWIVSNPNARDGNFIDSARWADFLERGNQVIYDAAYMGLTQGGETAVYSPNVLAVMTSPSKAFGVFHRRDTGIVYSREPVATMSEAHRFLDIEALLETLKLYGTFGIHELPRKYHAVQQIICQSLSQTIGAPIVPSDALLVAHASGILPKKYDKYRRVISGDDKSHSRFGLSRVFRAYEDFRDANSVII